MVRLGRLDKLCELDQVRYGRYVRLVKVGWFADSQKDYFCPVSRFLRPSIIEIIASIWKCPVFLQEMSGILDTRIPTYCNSVPESYEFKVLSCENCALRTDCVKFCIEMRVNVANKDEVKTFLQEFYQSSGCTFNMKSSRQDKFLDTATARAKLRGFSKLIFQDNYLVFAIKRQWWMMNWMTLQHIRRKHSNCEQLTVNGQSKLHQYYQ